MWAGVILIAKLYYYINKIYVVSIRVKSIEKRDLPKIEPLAWEV